MSVAEDPDFEKRWFRFERVMWFVMAALLASACLGVTSPGWLSRREAQKDALRVQYDAVIHEGAPSELEIDVAAEATAQGRIAIVVEGIVNDLQAYPSPLAQTAHERGTRLEFQAAQGKPAHVKLAYVAKRPGNLKRRIEREGGAAVSFSQLVLP